METTYDVYLRDCPSRYVLGLVSNRWSLLVICALQERPHRFGELRRLLDGVSQKVLTQTLRELEKHGLVTRTVFPTAPPSVEYALTPLGHGLCGPLQAVREWAERHIEEIDAACEAYEAQPVLTPQSTVPV
ncbi:winged helix-turn-helix transcriptional regulator [Longispora albida]|uniref:winged helix-turn-helix transcriptional regulator n=1 Tax=Longispora albida TaxID=203523 RepID=UPI00037DECF4|nr:helix-turn-helix domain-containing protein [Longispora albida]